MVSIYVSLSCTLVWTRIVPSGSLSCLVILDGRLLETVQVVRRCCVTTAVIDRCPEEIVVVASRLYNKSYRRLTPEHFAVSRPSEIGHDLLHRLPSSYGPTSDLTFLLCQQDR